ncbi:MAG: helix-turn-helix transcriptional regulator [Phascolarctobacterium sp.]
MLLILSGFLNPLDHDLEQFMDYELNTRRQSLERQLDNLAAHGINFSQKLSEAILWTLEQQNMSLEQLNGQKELLQSMQMNAYDIVTDAMERTSCSGAFYLLNASAGKTSPLNSYNGVYLKYANLYSENTLNNEICMFRGDYSVARAHGINLYSSWQLEGKAGIFPEIAALLQEKKPKLTQNFVMTKVTPLADSWEKVRLFLFPLLDTNGQALGLCGYELSNLYFQLRSTPVLYRNTTMITALLDPDDNDTYMGQLSDESTLGEWPLIVKSNGKYTNFISSNTTYIGKLIPVEIGQATHYLAIMLPENAYNEMLTAARLKAVSIFGLILLLFLGAGYFLNKKYVEPIVGDLQQLRTNPSQRPSSALQELDEVYDAWQSSDFQNKEKLLNMEQEKAFAQQEYVRAVHNLQSIAQQQQDLQEQYDQLQATLREQSRKLTEKMELLQKEKEEAERQYASAQYILKGYLDKDKPPIDEDSYNMFVSNLSQLTAKERAVFDLYLAGLVPKEITAQLDITENTLKYHNKNIYSKLGVKSRKELLQCIKYMQLLEKK